jgi:hypothetical protein
MVKQNLILTFTSLVVQNAKFIVVSCDKVITNDNQSWINVHIYVAKGLEINSYLVDFKVSF